MKFEEFINELAVLPSSSPELQTQLDKSQARSMLQKVRGLRPGRLVDAEGNSSQTPLAPAGNNNDSSKNLSMILKNTSKELVLVNEDENKFLYITYINKQRMTKRTITIDNRSAMFLKRFIR